jgi:hypothetical protein
MPVGPPSSEPTKINEPARPASRVKVFRVFLNTRVVLSAHDKIDDAESLPARFLGLATPAPWWDVLTTGLEGYSPSVRVMIEVVNHISSEVRNKMHLFDGPTMYDGVRRRSTQVV